jgi:predicted dehydrogenase
MSGAEQHADKQLRAAIIGCGRIAGGYDIKVESAGINTHAKAYQVVSGVNLVAVVDVDVSKAHAFALRWKVPAAYGSIAEMLEAEKPDIVSICTPDDVHIEALEMCLGCSSVRAVWCEKPVATDFAAAERVVKSYAQRGILLAVNYTRRWDEDLGRIKSAIQRGELGKIQKILVYYTKGIYHNGSHAVDLLIDWLGMPTDVNVFGSHIDYKIEDPTIDARLLFGETPAYFLGMDEREYTIFEINVLGTVGRVNVGRWGVDWYKRQADPEYDGYRELNLYHKPNLKTSIRPIVLALEEIVRATRAKTRVRSDGESALATLKVCKQLAMQALGNDSK